MNDFRMDIDFDIYVSVETETTIAFTRRAYNVH